MGLIGMVVQGIEDYTGLSVTALIGIGVMMIITYKIVCGMFVAVDDYKAVRDMKEVFEEDMRREPVQLGEVTEEELKAYDGSDPKKPLLMAIRGQIYDVSRGRIFYGPGGSYALFAGKDATRALALMSFHPQDLTGNIDGLSESELEVLADWELKFNDKYPKVGLLVSNNLPHQQSLDTKKAL